MNSFASAHGRMKIATALGILLLLVMVQMGLEIHSYFTASMEERLQWAWDEDVRQLAATEKLPEDWKFIRAIDVIAADDRAEKWREHLIPPVALNSDGHQRLEVLLISWEEDGQGCGAIIQYHLIDEKTGNTKWELGRTFKISGPFSSCKDEKMDGSVQKSAI